MKSWLFPGSQCTQGLVCVLQERSFYFSQSCGIPAIKSYWLSKPNALGHPCPDARIPGCEAWHGAQNSHSHGSTSAIQLFSGWWIAHPVHVSFDFIMIAPLLLFNCGFFFVFGCRICFFVGVSLFASDFSAVSYDYIVIVRGAMHKSSYSTIFFPALQHYLQLSTVFQLLL